MERLVRRGWSVLLLLVSLSGPAAVAALLATGEAAPLVLAQLDPRPGVVDEHARVGKRPRIPALTTGVLYTTGTAMVDWNGVQIPVSNGTYAYMGGEPISVGPDSMGILQLDGGATIVLCPDSKGHVTRGPGGIIRPDLDRGIARFLIPRDLPFEIDVDGHRLLPAQALGEQSSELVIGELIAPGTGAMRAAILRGALRVHTTADEDVIASSGELLDVTDNTTVATAKLSSIPEKIFGAMKVGHRGPDGLASVGTDFLCRSDELHRLAESALIADAEADAMAAEVSALAAADAAAAPGPDSAAPPPAASAPTPDAEAPPPAVVAAPPVAVAPPVVPPVAPPVVPPVAIAPPGAPNPFDPNVLPPPAAGPEPTALVLPPSIPGPGSGGGGGGFAGPVVSPS